MGGAGFWVVSRNEVIGRAKTDADGKYRLTVPRSDELMTYRTIRVVAAADGYGLSWKGIPSDAEQAAVDMRLTSVQHVTGHIVGLQGEDLAGVTIHVVKITRKLEKGAPWQEGALPAPDDLGLTIKTDAKGKFDGGRFGPGVKLECEIRDPGYERKEDWFIDTGDKKQCENISLAPAPGRYVEGRVVYEDTRKPVPHAQADAVAQPGHHREEPMPTAASRSLSSRLMRMARSASHRGTLPSTLISAPLGLSPTSACWGFADFPKGVVRREVKLALPRGILVRGKVTEAGTGKPIAGGLCRRSCPLQRTQAPSPGRTDRSRSASPRTAAELFVTHPSGEFIPMILGSGGGGINNRNAGSFEKPYGERSYYHAAAAVQVKEKETEKEVNFTLRRGVTIKGKFVGPDGKPVKSAVGCSSATILRSFREHPCTPTQELDGRFEVRGLDPDKKYRLLFLEHPNRPQSYWTIEAIESFRPATTPTCAS